MCEKQAAEHTAFCAEDAADESDPSEAPASCPDCGRPRQDNPNIVGGGYCLKKEVPPGYTLTTWGQHIEKDCATHAATAKREVEGVSCNRGCVAVAHMTQGYHCTDCAIAGTPIGTRPPSQPSAMVPPAAQQKPSCCIWWEAGCWESSCGSSFEFNEGGPKENGWKFCHKCGLEIVVFTEQDDEPAPTDPEIAARSTPSQKPEPAVVAQELEEWIASNALRRNEVRAETDYDSWVSSDELREFMVNRRLVPVVPEAEVERVLQGLRVVVRPAVAGFPAIDNAIALITKLSNMEPKA